jgi:hypothetical protein
MVFRLGVRNARCVVGVSSRNQGAFETQLTAVRGKETDINGCKQEEKTSVCEPKKTSPFRKEPRGVSVSYQKTGVRKRRKGPLIALQHGGLKSFVGPDPTRPHVTAPASWTLPADLAARRFVGP